MNGTMEQKVEIWKTTNGQFVKITTKSPISGHLVGFLCGEKGEYLHDYWCDKNGNHQNGNMMSLKERKRGNEEGWPS